MADRFIPKKGEKFTVWIGSRAALFGQVFIGEGEAPSNKIKAHSFGDKKAVFQFDKCIFTFKPCD